MTMTKFSRINKQREEITMRVLEDMEKGGNEWKKPWVEASPFPPHNPVSGTQYSGRNFLYTYVYGMMRGYADPRWAAEKGKRAKMQPKARLDAKKTCVDEAMRVMREQTDNSGDKAKCARITDISRK